MFKLASPDETYPTKVTVQVPTKEGSEEQEFTCDFRLMPVKEDLDVRGKGNEEFFAAAVRGWSGVKDHEGKDIPYSKKNAAMLAGVGYVALAVARAYYDRFSLEKNS